MGVEDGGASKAPPPAAPLRSPMVVSLLPPSSAGVPRSGAPLERGHQHYWWLEGSPSETHPARPSVHTWAGVNDAWPPAGHARRLPPPRGAQPPEPKQAHPLMVIRRATNRNTQRVMVALSLVQCGGPLPSSVWWPDGKVAGGVAPLAEGGARLRVAERVRKRSRAALSESGRTRRPALLVTAAPRECLAPPLLYPLPPPACNIYPSGARGGGGETLLEGPTVARVSKTPPPPPHRRTPATPPPPPSPPCVCTGRGRRCVALRERGCLGLGVSSPSPPPHRRRGLIFSPRHLPFYSLFLLSAPLSATTTGVSSDRPPPRPPPRPPLSARALCVVAGTTPHRGRGREGVTPQLHPPSPPTPPPASGRPA